METHMYKESGAEKARKHEKQQKMAAVQSTTAQHITTDPQLRLVFKMLLFEPNKPLINTRPLPYEAHI